MATLSLPATTKVFKYELNDVIRSKWMVGYALLFLVVTESLFHLGGSGASVLLSLTNAVLILIPLVSIVFGTMYFYHSRDFIKLLLAQPVDRGALYRGLYLGLALPLSASFVAGVAFPFLIRGVGGQLGTLLFLLTSGTLLTWVFTALALLIAVQFDDRVRGLGVAIVAWLFSSVLYDGLVLAIVNAFADYPLEKPVIALTLLNPVDLARVLLLLNFDVSALMGYTGAVFEKFFGSGLGMGISLATLIVWLAIPLLVGTHTFRKKDF